MYSESSLSIEMIQTHFFPRLKLWIAIVEFSGPDSWKRSLEVLPFFIGKWLAFIDNHTKMQLKPSQVLMNLEEFYAFLSEAMAMHVLPH